MRDGGLLILLAVRTARSSCDPSRSARDVARLLDSVSLAASEVGASPKRLAATQSGATRSERVPTSASTSGKRTLSAAGEPARPTSPPPRRAPPRCSRGAPSPLPRASHLRLRLG